MFKCKYSNQKVHIAKYKSISGYSMGYPKKEMPNTVQQDPLEASKTTQQVSR